jgi:hypothetical protein
MKHSARALLAITFAFVGIYAWNQPSATPEQLQAKAEAARELQADRQATRYLDARHACMDERPYSDARADCLWEAMQDNPAGYSRALKNALRAAAAARRAQQALDEPHEDLRGQKALDAARAQYYNGNTN